MATGCGNMYVTINETDEGIPIEVFCRLGKAGGCASSQTEALGRLITLGFKHGMQISEIVEELRGISCHQTLLGKKKILSCADAVAQILVAYTVKSDPKPEEPPVKVVTDESSIFHHDQVMAEVEEIMKQETDKSSATGACPDCGGPIAHEAGCLLCHSCGWSKC